MTTDKARKRAVRTRMTKTGERYAAARRHVVTSAEAAPAPTTEIPEPALPSRVAEPTMSDDAIQKGTGRTWDEWFRILDAWDATTQPHPAIARYLHEVQGVPGWWAQNVTVGYEWARGLRARHETSAGYQVSVGKTIAAAADDVHTTSETVPPVVRTFALGGFKSGKNSGANSQGTMYRQFPKLGAVS